MKIIPVIHHLTNQLTLDNAKLCSEKNAFGIFLISMTAENQDLPMLAKAIKAKYPNLKVGINLLGQTAIDSLETSLVFDLDMTWSDNAIVTSSGITKEAKDIQIILSGKNHLFFNSVAFKYQVVDNNPGLAAKYSKEIGFIPTTSGSATGKAADLSKVQTMKQSLEDYPLAIASGLTPDNVMEYTPYIEYGLVATGISSDFHTLNPMKTESIIKQTS